MAELDLGKCVHEEVRFAWLDEDGNQMSPTHEKLRSALNFVAYWQERYERITSKWGSLENTPSVYREALTRSGKAPVELERRIIRTYRAELTEAQQEVVKTFMDAEM